MTFPVRHDDKLDQVVAYITKYPEQHNQDSWFYAETAGDFYVESTLPRGSLCNTTACFAGWTLVLNKVPLHFSVTKYSADETSVTVSPSSGSWQIEAQEILGLTDREAEKLFLFSGNLEGVLETVDRIKADYYRTPEYEENEEDY